MAKTTQNSRKDRISKILNEFENEFAAQVDNLYFLVCKVYVSSGRRSTTLNHTDSKKHKNLYERNLAAINRYIKRLQGKYPDYFVSGFVWADTPVCKLRLKPMIDLFTYLKIKIPSETTI